LDRKLKLLVLLAALCSALLLLLSPSPSFATDCVRKPTPLDAVICANTEIKQVDDAMARMIALLFLRLGGREYATIVADQLRWREDMLRQCVPLATACLLPKYRARYEYLKPDPALLANDLYMSKGVKVGGLPLEVRSMRAAGVYIGEQQISGPVDRIDISERYTDQAVDALAFVANRGGSGADCAQFPVYIVAVRPDVPPEVLTVPNILGSAKGQQSCIDRITRTPEGLLIEIGAWPWVDGRTYIWKPSGGLLQRETTRFAPQEGTRMRDLFSRGDRSGRLNNEQFSDSLRRATTALDLSFNAAAEAFWFSWSKPYVRGDYIVIETCARPGNQDECTGDFVGKAVYEQRTDKIFFAFSTAGAPPECKPANGRDPFDAALRGVQFFPLRPRWQAGALQALTDLYCPNNR
jgi:uncharacterized protein